MSIVQEVRGRLADALLGGPRDRSDEDPSRDINTVGSHYGAVETITVSPSDVLRLRREAQELLLPGNNEQPAQPAQPVSNVA